MARQPNYIIPFRPFASGRKGRQEPKPTVDDRRLWFGSLAGETFANEVQVIGTGAWPNIMQAPPAPGLTEILDLKLPRPEPVSLSWHPWYADNDRFRGAARYIAHADSDLGIGPIYLMEGRIFIEWGAGQARNWTYCDLAPGALQLPAVSNVRVSAWVRARASNVAVTAQIGYAHSKLDGIWTTAVQRLNLPGAVSVKPPHYAREITGYFYSGVLAGNGGIALLDGSIAFTILQAWDMWAPIAPNPQNIPYPCVNVPLAGNVDSITTAIFSNGGYCSAACTVRI